MKKLGLYQWWDRVSQSCVNQLDEYIQKKNEREARFEFRRVTMEHHLDRIRQAHVDRANAQSLLRGRNNQSSNDHQPQRNVQSENSNSSDSDTESSRRSSDDGTITGVISGDRVIWDNEPSSGYGDSAGNNNGGSDESDDEVELERRNRNRKNQNNRNRQRNIAARAEEENVDTEDYYGEDDEEAAEIRIGVKSIPKAPNHGNSGGEAASALRSGTRYYR